MVFRFLVPLLYIQHSKTNEGEKKIDRKMRIGEAQAELRVILYYYI